MYTFRHLEITFVLYNYNYMVSGLVKYRLEITIQTITLQIDKQTPNLVKRDTKKIYTPQQ